MRDDVAWATVARVALDCMPTRRHCIVALVQTPGASTSSIAERTAHPSRSTRRALEELVAYGPADRDGADEQRHHWTLTTRATAVFAAMSAARIEAS
jgi:DNA-binding IclR family transcriptional regulator